MKLSLSVLAAAGTLALTLLGGTAVQAQVYDNGPINGTINAWTINYGYSISDSFTLSAPTMLTSAQIGMWMFPGDRPTSVDWSIGTSAFGSDLSSGMSSMTNGSATNNGFGYDVFESNFAINGTLAAGSYWFTLQNLADPSGNPGYWDENDGSSAAVSSANGVIGSHSFQLYGNAANTPEPGAFALMGGLGITGAAFLRRKRSK